MSLEHPQNLNPDKKLFRQEVEFKGQKVTMEAEYQNGKLATVTLKDRWGEIIEFTDLRRLEAIEDKKDLLKKMGIDIEDLTIINQINLNL